MTGRRLRITDGAPVEADYAKTVEEWQPTRPGAGCGSITRTGTRTKRIVSPGRRRVDLHSATAARPDGGARRPARRPALCTIRVARLRSAMVDESGDSSGGVNVGLWSPPLRTSVRGASDMEAPAAPRARGSWPSLFRLLLISAEPAGTEPESRWRPPALCAWRRLVDSRPSGMSCATESRRASSRRLVSKYCSSPSGTARRTASASRPEGCV